VPKHFDGPVEARVLADHLVDDCGCFSSGSFAPKHHALARGLEARGLARERTSERT
jgi:hypothetical protein